MSATFEVKVIAVSKSCRELKMFYTDIIHPFFKIYLNVSFQLTDSLSEVNSNSNFLETIANQIFTY